MIKKSIYYFLLFIFFIACEAENVRIERPGEDNTKGKVQSAVALNPANIKKGAIRIKLSSSIGNNIHFTKSDSRIQSNAIQINALLGNLQAKNIKRLFPHAGKYEGRTRKEGLHLWYTIQFDEKVLVSNAIRSAKEIKGVEIVEEICKPKTPDFKSVEAPQILRYSEENEKEPFNDPRLNYQWHYSNKGIFSKSKKGADINLYEAWKEETGTPNVIVAVVDGGIDYEHEDLARSMHINVAERDGSQGVDDDKNGYVDDIYGYNFVTNKGTVTAEEHGTHVAGTVAARNNNGVGVCGVAGGNGSSESGVRLISCQIFQGNSTGNSAAAIKYGADNGAVISQNSWGYIYPGFGNIATSDKEAIDYFIKYAGCDDEGNQLPNSPMKGGIVIFAAGNDDKDYLAYPAAYEATVAVSAMAPDFKKAWYTNRGEWVDIMAPGGDENYFNGMVLSSVPNNRYAYMQGTSMACPHVSGVAALVVSQLGGQGFTAENLRERLSNALRSENIDEENPDYRGKLGLGYIDALRALDRNKNKRPDNPHFISLTPDFSFIELKWLAVSDENDGIPSLYKLYYSKNILNKKNYKKARHIKVNAAKYRVGDTINQKVSELELNTTFYFALEAIDRSGLTSEADFLSGKTKENHAPVQTKEFQKFYIPMEKITHINLSEYFTDEDQQQISFVAQSDNTDIVDVKTEGHTLIISPKKLGIETFEITAIDTEGAEVKSNITVQVVNDGLIYVMYPVPVIKNLSVRLNNEVNTAKLTIRTTSGSIVFTKQVNVDTNNRLVVLNLKSLSGGTYILHAEGNGETFQQSFIKY